MKLFQTKHFHPLGPVVESFVVPSRAPWQVGCASASREFWPRRVLGLQHEHQDLWIVCLGLNMKEDHGFGRTKYIKYHWTWYTMKEMEIAIEWGSCKKEPLELGDYVQTKPFGIPEIQTSTPIELGYRRRDMWSCLKLGTQKPSHGSLYYLYLPSQTRILYSIPHVVFHGIHHFGVCIYVYWCIMMFWG